MYENEIAKLENVFKREYNTFSRLKGELNKLMELKKNTEEDIKLYEIEDEKLQHIKIIFQATSEQARGEAIKQIEYVVSQCLQYIFETDINCIIEVIEKNNVPSAEVLIESNYGNYRVVTSPKESRGGGVVDILSLSLRIAMLELIRPKIQGPLILDEPAKHVSEDFIVNVGTFLKETSRTFDRQVIMVTHNNYLSELADKSIQVAMINGKSCVNTV